MDGVLLCARYAFAPNYYKYCGPDVNRGIAAYLKEGVSNPGLSAYLSEFAVLYPYLNLIARENGIADPFDPQVVEAYWIGNKLLEKVGMKAFSEHLQYGQKLKKRLPPKKLKWIIEKVPKGARIHHSFHVFSIFTRTGHQAVDHTLETMDSCRIGWGQISSKFKMKNLKLKLKSQKLIYKNGQLRLKDNVVREVALPVNDSYIKTIKPGDWVTTHWGFVCDKVSPTQVKNLEFYTKHNLQLANETN
jgi:hypothetical protein